MALINESYIYFVCGNSYLDIWDVSNISNSTCNLTQRIPAYNLDQPGHNFVFDYGYAFGISDNQIYLVSNGITNSSYPLNVLSYPPYYASSYDWGYGARFATQTSLPSVSSNATLYVSAWGVPEYHYPASPYYKYVDGYLSSIIDSPVDAYGICLSNHTCPSDLITNATGSTLLYIFDRQLQYLYMADFSENENASAGCDAGNETIGTTCVASDSLHRIYVTNDGCNLDYEYCPSGSMCSQLTPQFNVTTALVEDYVSCQIRTGFGFVMNCFNICFGSSDTPIFSNCIDAECKHCTIDQGNYTGYNINKWYTNQTSVSVPSYTIACINTTTGRAVFIIDNLGNTTNETEILTRAGNSVWEVAPDGTCVNTSTLCFDSICNIVECAYTPTDDSLTALSSWVNNSLGTSFAINLLSMITSAIFSMFIFIKVKNKQLETFIVPFLLILGGFALISFFPLWLLLLMTVFTGVMIFWKSKT
jgi:hypothetical protein